MTIAVIGSTKPTPQLIAGVLKRAEAKLPANYAKSTLEVLKEESPKLHISDYKMPSNVNAKKQEIEARIAQREEEIYRLRTINQFVIKFSDEPLSNEEKRIYELKEQIRLDKAALMRIDIMA